MRLILILLTCCLTLLGQISHPGRGPYYELARGMAWGGSLENNYILRPIAPYDGVCFTIVNNNPTNAHLVSVQGYGSADAALNISGSTAAALTKTLLAGGGADGLSIGALSTYTFFINGTGTNVMIINVSGTASAGGTPDTADVFATIVRGNLSCWPSSNTHGGPVYRYNWTTVGFEASFVCDLTAAFNLSATGSTKVITKGTAGQTLRICDISFATDTAEDVYLLEGTGTNCGTGTAALTGVYKAVTAMDLEWGPDAHIRLHGGKDLCINQSAAQSLGGTIQYALAN